MTDALTVLFIVVVVIVAIWDVIWKLIGMYKAARNGQKVWFVFLMIINTAGILPIIYIAFFQKNKNVVKKAKKK